MSSYGSTPSKSPYSFGEWVQPESAKSDGYNLGNGKIFLVSGHGKLVTRDGKPVITDTNVSRTYIPVIVGPFYTSGCLAHGFEVRHTADWDNERVVIPQSGGFWGVHSQNNALDVLTEDIIPSGAPVFVRIVTVTPNDDSEQQIMITAEKDDRNARYVWAHNVEVSENDPLYRASVPENELVRSLKDGLVFKGAPHRIFQDPANAYTIDIPARFLAVRAIADGQCTVTLNGSTFTFTVGAGNKNKSVQFALVFATSAEEGNAVALSSEYSNQRLDDIKASATAFSLQRRPFLTPSGADKNDPFASLLTGSTTLLYATLAEYGGNFAQSCMYPMDYVRDQYGSVRHFIARGDYNSIKSLLDFYIAMQNTYGIQNSYDPSPVKIDPANFDAADVGKDSHYRIAEVPSYIILFADSYYRLTGDLDYMGVIYDRLRYNIYCQQISEIGLLHSPGDESYTQIVEIRRPPNFADSTLLFLKACSFMIELSKSLGKPVDSERFKSLHDTCKAAMLAHLWDYDKRYFMASVDIKKAMSDILLRQYWIRYDGFGEEIKRDCLDYALKTCINPVRPIEDDPKYCAGMEISYFLTALTAEQDPLTDNCAKLLCQYLSETGMMSKYYGNGTSGSFQWYHGNDRPWETGCAAAAFYDYALGMELDNVAKTISLRPHNPIGWNGYTSRELMIYENGSFSFRYAIDNGKASFQIKRSGGQNDFQVHVEFGGFSKALIPVSHTLKTVKYDLLDADIVLQPNKTVDFVFTVDTQKS